MAQFDLYVDTYSGDSVTGPANPTVAPLPKFVQGDTITLRIYLLARTTSGLIGLAPYSIINNSGLSLKVGLGPKDGTAGSTLYTQQFTWTPSADNTYFQANLPLNTAAITSLIGTASSASAWFEIELTQGGFPSTVLQKQVTIEAEVIETGVITVPPGQTALSVEEANAKFLQRKISGAIYLEDINNAGQYIAVYNENGSLKADVVTGTLP